MIYDLYVAFGSELRDEDDKAKAKGEVNAVVRGEHRGYSIPDIATRIRLLAGIAACNEGVKNYVISVDRTEGGGYKSLVHKRDNPKKSVYAKELITPNHNLMQRLGLVPGAPNLHALPPGSWFLQFTFTLAKPWMSKDDDPFYVADSVNPVRKDKVFKVPMMSAASWKGLLRWTAMHIRLVKQKGKLAPEKFAEERFRQAMLFGDEKGEEPGHTKDFAAFLEGLLPGDKAREARIEYERLWREHFQVQQDKPLPHHSGRLIFYPTFFDLIDVEVINPHKRETKAGTHPIYLECVPDGAKGAFSLLYVPFDLIGKEEGETRRQAAEDLKLVAEAISAMMLIYGFSAKRSSGYGTAKDEMLRGKIKTRADEKPLKQLGKIGEEVRDVAW